MDELRSMLGRKADRLQPDPAALDRLLARAERRQATRRRAALVVGIAVFVGGGAAAWTALRPGDGTRPAGQPAVGPTASPETSASADPSPTPPSQPSPASDDDWLTEEQRLAWQQKHGDGLWVAAYFLPADAADSPPDLIDPELRWKRIGDEAEDLAPFWFLGRALRELEGARPEGVVNALADIELGLRSAEVDGTVISIDLGAGILDTNYGSTGGMMMQIQLTSTIGHYYPEAETACFLLNGETAEPVFHDKIGCPIEIAG